MNTQTFNQEILLNTNSDFINRPFCKRDSDNNNNESCYSPMEELTRACWDGMLNELLPELAGNPSRGNENFIWNIVSGVNFLYLTMGPVPVHVEKETSLDPYCFLSRTGKN
jgi:hypothetical protein